MQRRILKISQSFLTAVLFLLVFATQKVWAQDCSKIYCDSKTQVDTTYSRCLSEQASCYEDSIIQLGQQKITLNNTIGILNGQISVQEIQINQTLVEIKQLETEVAELTQRIGGLNISLDKLSSILVKRVGEQYKRTRIDLIFLLFKTNSLNNFLSEYKYIKLAKKQTLDAMQRAESQRILYDEQKNIREDKQVEVENKKILLESQKTELAARRGGQQQLLAETKNKESNFQQKLNQLRAEMEAIQAIIAGKGRESDVGGVKKGDRIASVIQGASCNSNGTHLHFIATKDDSVRNPFEFLSNSIAYSNCSGSYCGDPNGDSFNPSGSWSWPISPSITLSQGYGVTWAVKNTWVGSIYSSHNGIDINGSSSKVVAVADGKLYQGAYSGTNGCSLKYVRLEHSEGNFETYYLHINY